MILSFKCKETEKIFSRMGSRKLPRDMQKIAYRKLAQIHAATKLESLAIPPGNMLEALKGGRLGQYSIRVNDQWRICFKWIEGNAFDVEIVDYH